MEQFLGWSVEPCQLRAKAVGNAAWNSSYHTACHEHSGNQHYKHPVPVFLLEYPLSSLFVPLVPAVDATHRIHPARARTALRAAVAATSTRARHCTTSFRRFGSVQRLAA